MNLTVKQTLGGPGRNFNLYLDGVMIGSLAIERDETNERGNRRIVIRGWGVVVDDGTDGILSDVFLDTSFEGASPAFESLPDMDQRLAADYGWTPYTAETFRFPRGLKAGDRVRDTQNQEGTVVVPPLEGCPYPGGSFTSVPVSFDYNNGTSISWVDDRFLEVIS
jgi:hypothetical protein